MYHWTWPKHSISSTAVFGVYWRARGLLGIATRAAQQAGGSKQYHTRQRQLCYGTTNTHSVCTATAINTVCSLEMRNCAHQCVSRQAQYFPPFMEWLGTRLRMHISRTEHTGNTISQKISHFCSIQLTRAHYTVLKILSDYSVVHSVCKIYGNSPDGISWAWLG